MTLNLKRPLLFFDIESTGLNIATDCIVELCFVKIYPGQDEPEIKTWRIRPWDYENKCQHPIDPKASEVNGIKDEDLVSCPTFYELSDEIVSMLDDCDLAGFNSAKFDLPLLAEEVERAKAAGKKLNIDLHEAQMVDVQNIYHYFEPRNLRAAYRFYCGGEDFENAHSAEADTVATYKVLLAQLDKYQTGDNAPKEILKNDINALAKFSKKKYVDFAGTLVYDENGEEILNIGKHKGKTARSVFETEPGYFAWVQTASFTRDTKACFARLAQKFKDEKRNALNRDATQEELNSLADLFNNRL